MLTKENGEKAVKITTLDASLQTEYAQLIEQGEDANLASLQFIISLDEKMAGGLTQEIAKASMLETAKGVKITPAVRASHIPSVTIAAKIIRQYENEISEIKVSKVLSLAVRVLADKKAKGAGAHIKSFETFEELDENTLTKAESQARDKGEEIAEEIADKADAITLETIVDSLDVYLKAQDLKTLKTSEIEKLHGVIARLVTIEKNSKTA
jgi:hypothetical protein